MIGVKIEGESESEFGSIGSIFIYFLTQYSRLVAGLDFDDVERLFSYVATSKLLGEYFSTHFF